jgi:hypothetical protein
MNPTRLIADLKALGIELVLRNGTLRARGPEAVLTPEIQQVIRSYRGPILAAVTGRSTPSCEPGIVWDPRGGVRVERVPDLRGMALTSAGSLPRPFPRMDFELTDHDVEPGRQQWWAFCGTSPLTAVAEALLVMDDPDETEAAEVRAICLLFWEPPTGRPTLPHVAAGPLTPPNPPSVRHAAHVADAGQFEPPHFNQEPHHGS